MKKSLIKNILLTTLLITPLFVSGCNTHKHTFNLNEPVWSWSEDKTSASLKFKCSTCDEFSEEIIDDDIVVVSGAPTCEEGATTSYTAEVTYQEQVFSDTQYENLSPLGHEFTSIVVNGINENGYDALSKIENITVTKICERGDAVLASNNEITIEYETDDNFLHYGDTSIVVKIKGTSLSQIVPIKVNKIVVNRPNADETSFVYNQNVQEYQLQTSEYYYIEGNKKTDAGTSKVVVKLANGKYKDLCWDDGTDADLEFVFTINKATPKISGLAESYTLSCSDDLDVSNVSTTIGQLTYKLIDDNGNESKITNVKGGTYTLVAKVEGNNNINEVVATATVISNHEEEWPGVNSSSHTSKIGNKEGHCKKCNETLFKPVEFGDLNSQWGFGFGMNGVTVPPADLVSEFPQYNESERSAYRDWICNNEVVDARMPRIDFRVFNHIQFVICTNAKTQSKLYTGIGYGEEDNLIPFNEHGDNVKYAFDCSCSEDNEIINVTIRSNYGLMNSFTITDQNIINGDESIVLKLHGGAWRQFVFDNVLLAHECTNFVSVEKLLYPGVEEVCEVCFKHKENNGEEIVYTSANDFSNNEFGFSSNNSLIKIGVDTTEDVGALKIGGSQGTSEVANISLPTINFKELKNVKLVFSCNANGTLIGINDKNTISTVSNTKTEDKSSILFKYDQAENALRITIVINNDSLTETIIDASVIKGITPVNLYASFKPWHYLAFSKLILNSKE